ncbi:hypothetical protein CLTEP_06600 [Clostridium tepidiprofundi DSM 19306]|uniref:Uncharacterized protein n=1 Tax=Clostridium tepidiprofundi DSM 19306 TaxID=1121338 RepID=A0A151B6H0_9CLOT|nr:hypothetical protein [Clostridium tepidiprofundi]KYH35484.1 hypothetical protein CLTEP_06600 [Clostridium tepidiprofundi DSM 19306]
MAIWPTRPYKLKEGEEFEPFDEVVAIETPVVYDQCRVNKCLYHPDFPAPPEGSDGEPDPQLIAYFGDYGTPITGGTFELLGIRDKQLKILSMSTEDASCPHKDYPKNVTVEYKITFWADVKTSETDYPIRSVKFELIRTDSALLNCPDHNSEISAISCSQEGNSCLDELKIKLVMLLEKRAVRFKKVERTDAQGSTFEDYAVEMAICYALLFKSELTVQLLVPSYNFYEEANICTQPCTTCPCEDYTPLGNDFYPDIDFDAFTPQPPV